MAAIRTLVTIVCLLVLFACSSTRVGYTHADWLIGTYAARQLDLDRDQRTWLRERIRVHTEWHRVHELPVYISLMSELQDRYADGLDQVDLVWALEHARVRYIVLAERVIPDIATLFSSLDDAQVVRFEHRLGEQLTEQQDALEAELALSQAEAAESHAGQVIRRMERWTGRLSRTQRTDIEAVLSGYTPTADGLERRSRRSAEFIDALRPGTDTQELEAMLRAWWIEPASALSMLDDEVRSRREVSFARTIAVDALLSDRQRQRVIMRLEAYRRDFSSLAGSA